MKIISKINESVLTLVRPLIHTDKELRWSKYSVHFPVGDNILIFSTLTRELILLSSDEYNKFTTLDYLRQHCHVVPENTNEKEIADLVKLLLTTQKKRSHEITGYTIFTTTDCNARCFYCFESGVTRVSMSSETARKIVPFIKEHSGNKKVRINWFGGEPLFNIEPIEIITSELREEGIEFISNMVTNGYLFDDEVTDKAINCWNLKKVQISLDGTEKVYNHVKSYIYQNTNPFEVVMTNISRMLKAGIRVSVRLNLDLYNAEDLLKLSEILTCRFGGQKGISVYAHHLFDNNIPDAALHSEEEWKLRNDAMDKLYSALEKSGLVEKIGIKRNIRLNNCMADSGEAVTILPNGNIGLCEHNTESEFIGHLDQNEFDLSLMNSWKERIPEIPECAECFNYLDCIKLKKCSTCSICHPYDRERKLKSTQRTMLFEYERWLNLNAENGENCDCIS